MKSRLVLGLALFGCLCFGGQVHAQDTVLDVSPELQNVITPQPLLWYWQMKPKTDSEWRALVDKVAKENEPGVRQLQKKLGLIVT